MKFYRALGEASILLYCTADNMEARDIMGVCSGREEKREDIVIRKRRPRRCSRSRATVPIVQCEQRSPFAGHIIIIIIIIILPDQSPSVEISIHMFQELGMKEVVE